MNSGFLMCYVPVRVWQPCCMVLGSLCFQVVAGTLYAASCSWLPGFFQG